MYVESSGDATFATKIESFHGEHEWSKGGIMFRGGLAPNSAHYSIFTSGDSDIVNNFFPCDGCSTVHVQTSYYKPDSVRYSAVNTAD